jgi:hypothetical protein
MAKAKVTHSEDSVQITFRGDPKSPEPSTAIIEFPGGHVEVSRCSDNTYWVHIGVVAPANVVDSRMDTYVDGVGRVVEIPHGQGIDHIAVRISNKVPRPDVG